MLAKHIFHYQILRQQQQQQKMNQNTCYDVQESHNISCNKIIRLRDFNKTNTFISSLNLLMFPFIFYYGFRECVAFLKHICFQKWSIRTVKPACFTNTLTTLTR